MKLISINTGGNVHDACVYLNKHGLSTFVVQIETVGYSSVVVLRVPDEDFVNRCKQLGVDPEGQMGEA